MIEEIGGLDLAELPPLYRTLEAALKKIDVGGALESAIRNIFPATKPGLLWGMAMNGKVDTVEAAVMKDVLRGAEYEWIVSHPFDVSGIDDAMQQSAARLRGQFLPAEMPTGEGVLIPREMFGMTFDAEDPERSARTAADHLDALARTAVLEDFYRKLPPEQRRGVFVGTDSHGSPVSVRRAKPREWALVNYIPSAKDYLTPEQRQRLPDRDDIERLPPKELRALAAEHLVRAPSVAYGTFGNPAPQGMPKVETIAFDFGSWNADDRTVEFSVEHVGGQRTRWRVNLPEPVELVREKHDILQRQLALMAKDDTVEPETVVKMRQAVAERERIINETQDEWLKLKNHDYYNFLRIADVGAIRVRSIHGD
jgi:hypothetical protein